MTQFPSWFVNYAQICNPKSTEMDRKQENGHDQEKAPANTQHPVVQRPSIQSRSVKRVNIQNYQISFQKEILDSHVMAFAEFFQKIYQNGSKQVITIDFKHGHKNTMDYKNTNYVEWVEAELDMVTSIAPEDKVQLAQDWKSQQNLCKLLKLITDQLEPGIRAEIFYLTSLIWQQYLKVLSLRWSEQEKIKKISECLASQIENIYCLSQLNFLCETENLESGQQAYLHFVLSLAETIYLVIEGYFENPICTRENRPSPRVFSVDWGELYEEDFELVGLPKKMAKLT